MYRVTVASVAFLFLSGALSCGRSDLGFVDDAGSSDTHPTGCVDDGECDDGNACNGSERCVEGECLAGEPIQCDDGVDCTADTCDIETGECVALPDHDRCELGELCDEELGCLRRPCSDPDECDDGFYCNGTEFCLSGYCEPGTTVDCNDGLDCTIDSCNEDSDACEATPDHSLCDDERMCNGEERCDDRLGCVPGPPLRCDDGDPCTEDRCDDDLNRCVFEPADADRDGFVSCGCAPPPCDCDDSDVTINPGMREQCRDLRDNDCNGLVDCDDREACRDDPRCVVPICEDHIDCADELLCNGEELCIDGRCIPGVPPECSDDVDCTIDECIEPGGLCLSTPDDDRCPLGQRCDPLLGCVGDTCTSDDECADGLFCNGDEICLDDGSCASGPPMVCDDGIDCTDDLCDERRDRCVADTVDERCDNGLFCDGEEQCHHVHGCRPGDDPCVGPGRCEEATCIEDEDRCEYSPIDNDDDGFVDASCGGDDCDDDDPEINPMAEEACDDGIDNDCNGLVDCDDRPCVDLPHCCVPTGPEVCDDGVDNDCDGRTDCDDLADCRRHIACCIPTGDEVCDDEIDNDCDGFTDCSDFLDCRLDPACEECVPELCWDSVDNDCDDLIDCDDPDCAWWPPCEAPLFEIDCHNGIDDDFDSLVDCDDPDCDTDPMCPEPDTCDDAIEITAAGTYTGSTLTFANDYEPDTSEPGCDGGRGPDAVYFGEVPETSWVRIDTFGSRFDTVLYVRADDCEMGEQVACDDDTVDLHSEVLFLADPDVVYYLFVDGFRFISRGDYVLHVEVTPIGSEICDNGIDDDLDIFVDCDDTDCDGSPECDVSPERGVDACTDGDDNDGDGLVDCDDPEDCAVVEVLGECCNGEDDNANGAIDEFACACDESAPCEDGYCYAETVGACGPSCLFIGGDVVCDWLYTGSTCSPVTNTCVY